MTLLIAGLAIFFVIHAVPALNIKNSLITKFGEGPYKGVFSLIAIAGMVMIVYGKGGSEFITIWTPPAWSRHATMLIMLLAVPMLVISLIPNNFRKKIRHPMLIAVSLWSIGHLLTNGDLASILLFGSFLIFAVSKMYSQSKRSPFIAPGNVSMALNVVTLIAGIVLYGVFVYFHRYIAGIPLF